HLREVVHLRHLSEENQRPVHVEKLERHLRAASQVVRLCHLNGANLNPVHDHSPAWRERQPDRPKVFRLRRMNAVNVPADRADRRRRNVASHRHVSWARVHLQGQAVVPKMFRRRVAEKDLNVKESAPRHQQRERVQMSVAALSVGRRRKFVSLVASRLRAVLPAKRAAPEKEGKAPMLNLVAHRVVDRLRQRSTARQSQRVERKSPKEERHRQGHNNSGVIFTAAPEQKLRSRFGYVRVL
ncbi:MAG TPA: hypothetical protein VE176_13570, partial [Candidatus Limnocylindrales bacterium]|nr:hypothetical protein [Candidatus Limnocylindrales bacterium]